MRVFYGFDELPDFRAPVVTVGSYDGVHVGHRELLGRINRVAAERNGESVVITFSPHPRIVLGQGEGLRLLNTLKEKILLMESVGVDNLIVAPFTEAFSRVSSVDFVTGYLVKKVGMKTLVAGYNHHFGYKKEGDSTALTALQEQFGFDIYVVPRQNVGEEKVSSTAIRALIAGGEMSKAARYLGQPYFMIVHSLPDGRIVSDEVTKLMPCAGIYPVTVEAAGLCSTEELHVDAEGGLLLQSEGRIADNQDFKIVFDR